MQQAFRLLQRGHRRRVEKRQRRRIADAPLREVEHQRREIGAEDFRLGEGRQRRRLRLIPETVADAGFGTAGAAAALIDRGARGPHGFKPRQPDIRLVARHPRQTRIDHDAHALDGQRGLGDRGRQHHLAVPFRRRRDGAVLHGRFECAEQRHDFDRRIVDALGKEVLGAADFGGARQECQHRTGIGAQRGRDRIRHLAFQRHIGLYGRDSGSRPRRRGLRWQSPAPRRAVLRPARRRAWPTSRAGANPRAGRFARRAPTPVRGRRRASVHETRRTAPPRRRTIRGRREFVARKCPR